MMSELDATTKLLKDAKLSQSQTSYNMEKLLAEHSTLKDETKELQSSHSAKGQSLIEEQRKSVILQTKLAAVELTLQQLRAEKGGTLTPAAVKLAATEAELGSASLLANGSPLEALETLPPPQHREEENSQALPDPPSARATSPEHRQNLGEGLPDPLSKRAAPEEQQESLRALPDPLARHGTPEAARESDRSLPRPLPTWSGPAASQPPGTALPAPMAGPAAPEQQQETGKGMPDPLSRLAAPEALREESAKVPDRLGQQLAPEERLQETRKSLRAAAT